VSSLGRSYRLISCTKKAVFNSSLQTLRNVRVLVTSVLANFICDDCVGDDVLTVANQVLTDHIETLHKYSQLNPGTKIVVAPPLPRAVPDWFNAYGPGFASFLYHEISRVNNPGIRFMAPFVAPMSFFESDGVHLNSESGVHFVNFLIGSADTLFPDVVDLPPPQPSLSIHAENSQVATAGTDLAKVVSDLDAKLTRRISQDNLIFARIKEDRDVEINRSKEDRFTISGVKLTSTPPLHPRERKDFFKELIGNLVKKACPDLDPTPCVLDVIVNMRPNRGPPIFEVKMDSVASSSAFRLAASRLAKSQDPEFAGLFVTNTVNLSTRIRIDILKLLAKRLTTDLEVSYVHAFSSRPTLHLRPREEETPPPGDESFADVTVMPLPGRSYTFAECMEKWGHLLPSSMLAPIRQKALSAFRGCLEQYFVVLSDIDPTPDSDSDTFYTRLTRGAHSSRGRSRGFQRRPWRSRGVSSRAAPPATKRPFADAPDDLEPATKKLN
jgi:hypothetical protein